MRAVYRLLADARLCAQAVALNLPTAENRAFNGALGALEHKVQDIIRERQAAAGAAAGAAAAPTRDLLDCLLAAEAPPPAPPIATRLHLTIARLLGRRRRPSPRPRAPRRRPRRCG